MKFVQMLKILAVCAFVALAQNVLFGQAVNFAQIQGRISDATGAAIVGAQITANQTETGLVRTTVTGSEGNYSLPNLPVGPYQLKVSATGFRNYSQTGIVLQVGGTPQIDIKLVIGSVAETVEVKANAALVETHDNAISSMIDNARILELPLDGRNMVSLVMASGAATNPTLTSNDLNSTKNYGNGVANGPSQPISVGGGQENANNYLLDGSDNNDAFSNVNAPYPFPDAVQEFSVQSSGLSARYGVHAGATVNAVTKSGTNAYHGSVFEFLRNPAVNARLVVFSTGAKDESIKRNQYGGTFGGPIIKDKLLFFMGFQGTRQSASAPFATITVPTPAALTGDFSVMMSAACQGVGKAKTLKTVNGITIPGNKVNPANFNASALALLHFVPPSADPSADPNGCGKISYSYPQVWNEDQGVTKVDWNLSSKQTLFGRYFITDSRAPLPFDKTNIVPQSVVSNQFARFQTMAIGHTFTISPNVVNSIHLSATRLAINRGPANDMINPASIGINVPAPIPNGLVLSISNYFATGGGSSMPGHFINNLYQIADDVDIVHGRHQFSFGVNFMKMQLNYISTFQSNGQFTFNTTGGSGDNLVDFMLGFPSSFAQGNPEAENWRYTYWGLYAADNIKLRPNLTLNVGVRWEPYFPSTDIMKRGSHFDFAAFQAGTHSTVFPNAPAGLQYCGDPGVPCAYAHNKLLQFSPRIGLIWDPTKKGDMTVRASYGLFYDSPEMYFFDRYADNSPYGSGVSFTPNLAAGATLTNPYAGTPVPKFPLPFPQPGDPAAFFPLNGVYINNEFDVHPMNVQNWNLSFEKQLASDWLLSLSYLGSKTTHVWVAYEANPGLNVNVPAAVASSVSSCSTFTGAKAIPGTGNTNCRRALVVANPLQGQYFSNMTSLWDGANANYHAMLVSLKHRFAHNYTLLSNYTWSHCISDQDFTGELTNSRPDLFVSPVTNPNLGVLKGDRGNCGFDIRHTMNVSVVANTPKFQGWKGVLLNNWQIAPLLTYRTGIPFTVLAGTDRSLTGTTTSFKDRPDQVGDPLSGTCANGSAVGTLNCWFNTAAFTAPATPNGTFGNVGRNSLTGPGGFTLDTALSRKFVFGESKELALRLDTFNLLNHPVLGNPVASVNNTANFGKIQSQIGFGRTLQAAVKFSF